MLASGPVALAFDGVAHEGRDARFTVQSAGDDRELGLFHVPLTALYELTEQEPAFREAYPALFDRPWVNIRHFLEAL